MRDTQARRDLSGGGIFLGFDDQGGAGVYHLSAGARGFSVRICFSGSIVAFFGVIDIAERPEVYYPCGQVGNFIGRSRNSWRRKKEILILWPPWP